MALFKTINTTIDKENFTIKIANFDISGSHWHSEKLIASVLAKFEEATYDDHDFNNDLLNLARETAKLNHRITRSTFYSIKDSPNHLILAHIVKMPNFADLKRQPFDREARIDIKKKNRSLSIIDIPEETQELIERKKILLPETWVYETELNNLLDIYAAMG